MVQSDLAAKLGEIKRLAEEALAEIDQKATSVRKGARKSSAPRPARKTLPVQILQLRDAGFFRQSKAAPEVHKKINATYPCDLNRVAMALLRLRRRKQLRKATKIVGKKKQVAYVW